MVDLNSTDQKWKALNSVLIEINTIQSQSQQNSEDNYNLNEMKDRLIKIKDLKNNTEKDDHSLKLEYLTLMRERNVYFEKLKKIKSIGDENQWTDSEGLLSLIGEIIDSFNKSSNNEKNN